jgi:hypothetical protein
MCETYELWTFQATPDVRLKSLPFDRYPRTALQYHCRRCFFHGCAFSYLQNALLSYDSTDKAPERQKSLAREMPRIVPPMTAPNWPLSPPRPPLAASALVAKLAE